MAEVSTSFNYAGDL